LIPAATLLMPYFVTVYGVLYVQYAAPVAATVAALGPDKLTAHQHQWLQYWVLHALVQGCLNRLAGILWWIPLSTHAVFLLWCYLAVLPQAVTSWYAVLQDEWQSLGLLPPPPEGNGEMMTMEWEATRTARAVSWILDRLPSAATTADDVGGIDETAVAAAGSDKDVMEEQVSTEIDVMMPNEMAGEVIPNDKDATRRSTRRRATTTPGA